MRDRQIFEETMLPNGIWVYRYPLDVPFTRIILKVPVGSAHNVGSVLPGSYHFLEHLCCNRSRRYPEHRAYERKIGLAGGNPNATTNALSTDFLLEVSTNRLEEMLPGFFSRVFEPFITAGDIANEAGIIASERKKDERWYPGTTELEQYLDTQWMWDYPISLRQALGSDEDHARMTAEGLLAAHGQYLRPGVIVVIGGSGEANTLLDMLAHLTLKKEVPAMSLDPLRWVNPEFHVRSFRDLARCELRYGFLTSRKFDPLTMGATAFVLLYLTNKAHGPLYYWLRHERALSYDLSYYASIFATGVQWTLRIPLPSREAAEAVRAELWDRVNKALSDEAAVSREVDRRLGRSALQYQLLDGIMREALGGLETFGRVQSEAEINQNIEACRDARFLRETWERHYPPETISSFLAVPESQ